MISISDLDFHFGSRALYDGASLHIKPKDKIGLIGLERHRQVDAAAPARGRVQSPTAARSR
jgi:hypothetical protein